MTRTERDRRADPTRPARVVTSAVLAAALVVAAVGCVGKTGRNDDDVAPGSGGGPSGNVVPDS